MVSASQLEQPHGLLDGISNPEFYREIERQRAIVQHVADHFGLSFDDTLEAMLEDDANAVRMFSVGNTVPRNWVH